MSDSPDLAWCFSTLGCTDLTLPEIAALARANQISQVEIRAVNERLDLPTYFTETFGDAPSLRAWLAQTHLKVAALDSSAKLIGCSPEAREELLGFGQWAHDLEIPGIRVFDGGSFQPELSAEDRDEALAFLAWWDELCAERGWQVKLLIETHDALCSAHTIATLAQARDGKVDILWDAHHTWKKGGEAIEVTWPVIKHLVRHIHFKDSITKPSARHPFTYVPLGEGEFPLSALLDMLRADAFAGPVSLEWERKWHPYLAPLADALPGLTPFRT